MAAAAKRKRDDALARATAALNDLDARGQRIDFQAVAGAAGVSRQWLYKQPQLRAQIERLREISAGQTNSLVPARERSTEASLRQRVQILLDTNRSLREENTKLKDELACLYGGQREQAVAGTR